MGQRKLTSSERYRIDGLRFELINISETIAAYESRRFFSDAIAKLMRMIEHGTTDGKPYVEPQPEIGEGYRVATEADKHRKDVEFWSKIHGKWSPRNFLLTDFSLCDDYHYRVPIDRTPTDDDARERPLVMVRDFDWADWIKRPLLAVTDSDRPFIVRSDITHTAWTQCRFPYPGE